MKMPKMNIVSAEKLWEEMRQERAEAESGFLSFKPFTMDSKEGLFITVETKRGTKIVREDLWLTAPFEIIGRVRDPHSHGWARLLQWRDDDDVIHQHTVADQDLHGDGGALCATLANSGLKIVTGSSRQHFITYLNRAIIEARITIVPRTGWHEVEGRKTFVLPYNARSNIIVAGTTTVSPYTTSGTLNEWQDSIGKLTEGHNRARFAISVAFAPPLLDLIGESGGGFNLRGTSSMAKLPCSAVPLRCGVTAGSRVDLSRHGEQQPTASKEQRHFTRTRYCRSMNYQSQAGMKFRISSTRWRAALENSAHSAMVPLRHQRHGG